MRNRSGVPDHKEDLAKMTAAELDQEIARVISRRKIAATAYQRKVFFQRLVWLEAYREAEFGVPAPKRTMRARQS